ncbi:NET1-associated nuclear protein 1 [Lithohypha guttulata]|uniref:NET1-associated nuclear protein 1 n=1 Tax=Lithohypha guttulata TaxID=1690604 RepID=UPI002DDFB267|nr:NET1-associated nuclear protein 1 [Lithohypha guttulata]
MPSKGKRTAVQAFGKRNATLAANARAKKSRVDEVLRPSKGESSSAAQKSVFTSTKNASTPVTQSQVKKRPAKSNEKPKAEPKERVLTAEQSSKNLSHVPGQPKETERASKSQKPSVAEQEQPTKKAALVTDKGKAKDQTSKLDEELNDKSTTLSEEPAPSEQVTIKKKRSRSRRKEQASLTKIGACVEVGLPRTTIDSGVRKEPTPIKQSRPQKSSKESGYQKRESKNENFRNPKDGPGWIISEPSGGAFIAHDPIVTPDEQFVILATKWEIQVYATKTSLLVRTIPAASGSEIVVYAQVGECVIVGLADGGVVKYNWTNGQQKWARNSVGRVTSIVSTSSTANNDGLLVINQMAEGHSKMTSLAIGKKGELLGNKKMLKHEHLILQRICFDAALGIVVVCSRTTIHVGRLGEARQNKDAPIHWQRITIRDGKVACFDAQILPQPEGSRSEHAVVDVAVGLNSGEIQIFNDVLNKGDSYGKDAHARRLHWHRSTPRTVKFSPDSNYLISGGDETVLVIWQLDTNQKQFLPHLSTPILNATVSERGSSYALLLGDNSVMILSTSDLKPFANISGLACHDSSTAPFLTGLPFPAVMHPNHSNRVLLAYSLRNSDSTLEPSEKSSNMLQTYDVAARLQLGRQALARNLAATVNLGPGGQPLKEPNVTHLQITHDGKWLVTVDQWSPADIDTNDMYLKEGEPANRDRLNECFLRFWSTNASENSTDVDVWELNTRIDEPVTITEFMGRKGILAVTTNPARLQVAVADSSRHIKVYSPKARIRSGVPVKDINGQQLFTWTCDKDIPVQEATQSLSPLSASLAFSEDGSVLAASWTTGTTKPRVHMIEPKSGTIAASLPHMVSNSSSSLAFCGRYLLALSAKFCIFDTVTMRRVLGVSQAEFYDPSRSRLAVDTRNGIAAMIANERDTRTPSEIVLVNVHNAGVGKLQRQLLTSHIQVLLADREQGGFVAIDRQGRTLRIAPPSSSNTARVVEKDVFAKATVRSTLENIFGLGRQEVETGDKDFDGEASTSVNEVLRAESSAQTPAPTLLFDRMARMIGSAAAKVGLV